MRFRFLDPGQLVDRELELVRPDERYVPALLHTAGLPESASDSGATSLTYSRLMEFLREAPRGLQPADAARGLSPTYHFWMRLNPPHGTPPVEMAGGLNLRIGHTVDLEMYSGHVGYGVYPPARGRHYAERASRLLFTLARAHGMRQLWITCNPDNWPSRRTCERLGGALVETVDLPADHVLYRRGERQKCRYRIDL